MTHNSKFHTTPTINDTTTHSKGYYYNLGGEHIYHIIVVGCDDSFYHDHWSCTMTSRELTKFVKTLKTDMYSGGDWELTTFIIASNITPTQSKKFEDLLSSWDAINQVMMHFDWSNDVWKDNWWKDAMKEIHKELDISKWNPRSVLGKLDFDRRAEDDGIIFSK